jgi:hypothetical protein
MATQPKLTKNEAKVYNIILKAKNIEQPKIVDKLKGEYKNEDSKRVVVSLALTGLEEKKMIKKVSNVVSGSGLPINVWEAVA